MKTLSFLSAAVLTGFSISPAGAHDNYFLPGDAFFSTSITRDFIREWSENRSSGFDVTYSRFDGKFEPPGHLGYKHLTIEGVDNLFRESLTKAYWRYTALERPLFRLENDDRDDLTQVNGVVALIYNRKFNNSIGLKFNENWQMEGLRRYSGLFKTAEPIIKDWGVGPEVGPLVLARKIPPLAHIPLGGEERLAMQNPVSVNSSDIKIVLVGFARQEGFEEKQTCPNLQKIYDKKPGTEYIEVDQRGFTSFSCDENGRWLKARTNITDDKSKSNY